MSTPLPNWYPGKAAAAALGARKRHQAGQVAQKKHLTPMPIA